MRLHPAPSHSKASPSTIICKQVLNLLPRQRQLAVCHLDTVVTRIKVAAGDHHTSAIVRRYEAEAK